MNALMSIIAAEDASLPVEDEDRKLLLLDYIRQTGFKRILNQIVSAQVTQGFKTLSVLSYYPGEGRTFLVSALAVGYARYLDTRVLILDTINQTRQRSLYLEPLLGRYQSDTYRKLRNREPGSVELLSTKSIEQGVSESSDFQLGSYLNEIKDQYDIILLDTCPLGSVTTENLDPIILAQYTDTSIFLTSPRSLNRDCLSQVEEELEHYGVNLLGTVYNSGNSKGAR